MIPSSGKRTRSAEDSLTSCVTAHRPEDVGAVGNRVRSPPAAARPSRAIARAPPSARLAIQLIDCALSSMPRRSSTWSCGDVRLVRSSPNGPPPSSSCARRAGAARPRATDACSSRRDTRGRPRERRRASSRLVPDDGESTPPGRSTRAISATRLVVREPVERLRRRRRASTDASVERDRLARCPRARSAPGTTRSRIARIPSSGSTATTRA